MKKLLIPVIIAVLAGVGGGSGFSYMRVSKAYVVDSLRRVDSLKANPPAEHDSTAVADASHDSAHAPTDTMPEEEVLPMTPADSIRALAESRRPLRKATGGIPDADAQNAAHEAPPEDAHGDAHGDAKPAASKTKAVAHNNATSAPQGTSKGAPKPLAADSAPAITSMKAATSKAAEVVREARNDAMATALPEQRLAKIFAAMSAKDAAKVMEQMSDGDVRSILSLMNDRGAAAVLSQFPAARAAAITKGALRANGGTP